MKLGLCTDIGHMEKAIDLGYDYVILSGKEISALDDRAFQKLEEKIREKQIPVLAFNGLCPAGIDIAGPDYSRDRSETYMKKLIRRGAILGVQNIGVGAPGSRVVPQGYDRSQSWKQCEEFIRISAAEAQKYDIRISVEELTEKYCNFINTLEESRLMQKDCAFPNIGIIVDFFHMEADGKEPEEAAEYIDHRLYDVHISGIDNSKKRPGRPFVEKSDLKKLKRIAKTLKRGGYDRTVSLEPDSAGEDFEKKAAEALNVMKKAFC